MPRTHRLVPALALALLPGCAVFAALDTQRQIQTQHAQHVESACEQRAIQAARDSLAFNAMFRKGIAVAQERLPPP